MSTHFPIEKTVKARRSIRTYESNPLSPQTKEQLNTYIAAMTNPFSIPVAFQFLEVNATSGGEKLGWASLPAIFIWVPRKRACPAGLKSCKSPRLLHRKTAPTAFPGS